MEPFFSPSRAGCVELVTVVCGSAASGAFALGSSALVAGVMMRSPVVALMRKPVMIRREHE
ncbi:MAG TPA: hypothetical protein VFI05_04945 [Nitrospiraceae bacterium]|nr:hypothetical protein [Nitrospiraceae bacterium]